ncbi:hypothetical protein EG329_009597 [Mollisiaceae sp. DMI_Dod_QoI]|nr:hypothetical protein EG329_009597 [Helotiales sp. DMI_Dod_QoI]
MASKPETVLLTGATGSLGSSILPHLLSSGYSVLVVLRSIQKSAPFLTQKYQQHVSANTLKFVQIPDLSAQGIFDDLAKKVDAIIHVATPLSTSPSADEDFETTMIKPTWEIDLNILTAAQKSEGKVKRVIICSSIVTVINIAVDVAKDQVFGENDYNTIGLEAARGSLGGAYMYSKTQAEKKGWAFMKEQERNGEELGFDLVTLCAPALTGRCIQEGFVPTKDALGGNGMVYREIFDRGPDEGEGFMFPYIMDFDDVAKIHIKALDRRVASGRYIFHIKELVTARMMARKIREEFPELRDRVAEPKEEGDGLMSPLCRFDTEKADKAFGTEWMGWWESIRGAVEDILEYEKKSGQ